MHSHKTHRSQTHYSITQKNKKSNPFLKKKFEFFQKYLLAFSEKRLDKPESMWYNTFVWENSRFGAISSVG